MYLTFLNKYCCCFRKKYYDYSNIDQEWDEIMSDIELTEFTTY
jgi:hypothetical protein